MVIKGTKKVFLDPRWKMREEFKYFIQNPPPGYDFVIQETSVEKLSRRLARRDYAYAILAFLDRLFPIELAKPYWDQFKKPPKDTALTYAVLHPVFRKEPWILDMQTEQPHLLIGGEATFERWKWMIKGALFSSYCKKIVFQLEAGAKAFLERFKWPKLESKVAVVHSSVPRKEFIKSDNKGKVKLLFVNSANINVAKHFQVHGGLVVLEAFSILRQRYSNVELIMRSGLPKYIKERYSQQPGITIYDEVIPWTQLEAEFKSADIFVYPTNVTPSIVFLDAMSYELPIVTTDIWGNPEIIADGQTGLLVHHPLAAKYTDGFVVHFDSLEFKKAISAPPPGLIDATVVSLGLLIDNPELRRKMGKAGRWEVEAGKFSIEKRNDNLKKIFDEAIDGYNGL